MKIYERFVSGFLVGFRFVAFGFGAAFTTVWLCLCPVSLSLYLFQITELFLSKIQNK